jgi:hypothetical protein
MKTGSLFELEAEPFAESHNTLLMTGRAEIPSFA